MIFGIFGLYEFWRLTDRDDVRKLLVAALTTIEENIDRFRVPGGVSYYCLGHKRQNEHYHGIVTRQLRRLDTMTESSHTAFADAANQFESDFQPDE